VLIYAVVVDQPGKQSLRHGVNALALLPIKGLPLSIGAESLVEFAADLVRFRRRQVTPHHYEAEYLEVFGLLFV
jgi:hypothetical protein